jgi:phage antirepressor YoqD-like protein
MAPKALYCDLVLQSEKLVPVSLIAKDYGMSAAAFNAMLHDFGIQYPMGGTWLPYQKYAKNGYTKTRTYHVGEKTAAIHTCWTQKGRLFLYEFLGDFGIRPLMESRFEGPFPA